MTTILLAVGSPWLRLTCKGQLQNLGYTTLCLERPLAPISIATVVGWDAALLDESPLGKGALTAFALLPGRPLIGLGLDAQGLAASLELPLQEPALASTLESVLFGEPAREPQLKLEPSRRLALANGRQVRLTQTEFRLLQLLFDIHPADVPLSSVLIAVWGSSEGTATSELVRSHLRNLRRKLESIGLPNAIRSRRGLGYSLQF